MPETVRHRVGLVGAGAICPHHVAALRRLPQVEIVGVHDLDPARASRAAGELRIRAMPSLAALAEEGADAIHVLTPPHAHVDVGLEALERGCHVLIEKPLAQSVEDCEALRRKAELYGRLLCVDHSLLFDPIVRRAYEDVRAGAIGKVVSVDVLRGSSYPAYRGGPMPPHYQSAGYPFRDLGVHALYLMQAFLGRIEGVDARWRSLGGDRNLAFDEWRAIVRCQNGTGQLQLTFNVKPMQHQIIIQGTEGVLRLDLFAMFKSLRASTPLPKAAERLLGGMRDAIEPLPHMLANAARFALGSIKPFQGVHELVAAFYRALDEGGPPPIDIREATEVVRWTEEVARAADRDAKKRITVASESVPFLVTGASGAVGRAVVARLLQRGERVRCFVRRPPDETPPGMEIAIGDLGNRESVTQAVRGAHVVIHAGAAMRGDWEEHRAATVEGTRHVLDACIEHGVEKLVHVSSLSVVAYADGQDGDVVSEFCTSEPWPERRGAYTRAKLAAEQLVEAYVVQQGLRAVILRPGQIFGGGIPLLTPAVARRIGNTWLVLGDGEVRLPLIYMDDVVDAILLAAVSPLAGGEIIQLTDQSPTQNEVLARAVDGERVVHLPPALVFATGKLSEPMFEVMGRSSPVSSYRLRSALAKRRFQAQHAHLLGWQPRVGVVAGIERELGMYA